MYLFGFKKTETYRRSERVEQRELGPSSLGAAFLLIASRDTNEAPEAAVPQFDSSAAPPPNPESSVDDMVKGFRSKEIYHPAF